MPRKSKDTVAVLGIDSARGARSNLRPYRDRPRLILVATSAKVAIAAVEMSNRTTKSRTCAIR